MISKRMRRKQRQCFHHELPKPGPEGGYVQQARSFIRSCLIDLGRRKMFWCDEEEGGCGKVWIV